MRDLPQPLTIANTCFKSGNTTSTMAAALRDPRLPVGSQSWIDQESNATSKIIQDEVDEFSFSARNEFEWLNDHMYRVVNEQKEEV